MLSSAHLHWEIFFKDGDNEHFMKQFIITQLTHTLSPQVGQFLSLGDEDKEIEIQSFPYMTGRIILIFSKVISHKGKWKEKKLKKLY